MDGGARPLPRPLLRRSRERGQLTPRPRPILVTVRAFPAIRAAGIGGLATTAAALAHGGGQVASDPVWMAAGLAGALTALAAARLCWSLLCANGDSQIPMPLPLLATGLLGAQFGAHLGLLAAGAPAHTGVGGSIALHAVLALAAALLVRLLERGAERALQGRREVHLRTVEAPRRAAGRRPRAGRRLGPPVGGRAPPEPA